MRSPCVRCGNPLALDSGAIKVSMSLTLEELESLLFATAEAGLRRRILCAIGLVDPIAERRLELELRDA